MRVAFDSEIFLLQKIGGVSRYFASLIEEFTLDSSHQVQPILTFSRSNNLYIQDLRARGLVDVHNMRVPYLAPTSPLRSLLTWSPIHDIALTFSSIPSKTPKVDFFHATYYRPNFFERRPKSKLAVTIHDFIPEKLGWKGIKNPHVGKRKLSDKADLIFCVSEATAIDFEQFYGIRDERIRVIGHGAKRFGMAESKLRQTENSNMLLFVGHRTGYKNFEILINALSRIAQKSKDIHLVTVGPLFTEREKSNYHEVFSRIQWTHKLEASDEELASLYQKARVLIVTSKMEGYGMPIIEALAMGTSVIASDIPVFREVGSTFVTYFDSNSDEDLAHKLSKTLDSQDTILEIQHRISYAKKNTWAQAADRISTAYRELA